MTLESNHSSRRAARPFGALLALCGVAACVGQTATFTPMGPTPPQYVALNVRSITEEGVVLCTFNPPIHAGYWSSQSGFKLLPGLCIGCSTAVGFGGSPDGSYTPGAVFDGPVATPVMWIDMQGPYELMQVPPQFTGGIAFGSSWDGSVVGGQLHLPSGATQGFVFSKSQGLELIPFGPGDTHNGVGQLPEFGDVVLSGVIHGAIGGSQEGYRWTREGGVELLGDLPGGGFFSNLGWCSSDGRVGAGRATDVNGTVAARWTVAHGWQSLEKIGQIASLSGDGWVVVGPLGSSQAWIWNPIDGTRLLADALLSDNGFVIPQGWSLFSASAISENGQYIAGYGKNPQGAIEGFLVEMPPFCYADCDRDKQLTFFDFLCYINHFDAEDIYSNCNNDGAVDFFDFLCFINKWHGGCP